jgi:hypothetical protein
MYLRSGSYYFVEYGTNAWINLGRDYVKAMAEYARIRGPGDPVSFSRALVVSCNGDARIDRLPNSRGPIGFAVTPLRAS